MDRAALESFAMSKKAEPEYRPEDELATVENRPENPETAQKNHPESKKTAQKGVGKTAQNIIDILVGKPHCAKAESCEIPGNLEVGFGSAENAENAME